MKEITFIHNNIDRWQTIETIATNVSSYSPDDIADAYTDVTADLAFAYTNYPESRITQYLNNLASVLHNAIYGNKREKRTRIFTFWSREVPLVMYESRKLLLVSLLIMLASVLVGIISQLGDHDFARIILGDYYVDMTLENIKKGEPMGVYASDGEVSSFLGITLNNVKVSFSIFASGLLTSIASGLMLFYNGVMLGCFETFFWQHGVFWESFFAVFLHGTLEMSAITVAGAAGLSLGNGMLFPGTYSRMRAFRDGAKRGLKIVVGTVPVFIVAGFIEGFATRHTEIGEGVRLMFILLCAAFVVYYYVILPYFLNKKTRYPLNHRNQIK